MVLSIIFFFKFCYFITITLLLLFYCNSEKGSMECEQQDVAEHEPHDWRHSLKRSDEDRVKRVKERKSEFLFLLEGDITACGERDVGEGVVQQWSVCLRRPAQQESGSNSGLFTWRVDQQLCHQLSQCADWSCRPGACSRVSGAKTPLSMFPCRVKKNSYRLRWRFKKQAIFMTETPHLFSFNVNPGLNNQRTGRELCTSFLKMLPSLVLKEPFSQKILNGANGTYVFSKLCRGFIY